MLQRLTQIRLVLGEAEGFQVQGREGTNIPERPGARFVSFRVQNTRNEARGVPMPLGVLRHALQAIFGC